MRVVGIDIGSYSLKVAEVESHTKSTIIRDFREFELSHELGQDTRLEKLEALRKIATVYDPFSTKFVVGIGSELCTQRVLTFPFRERKKIFQSLPFELEENIPFTQEDAIFDFRIIDQKGSNSTEVLALAVPKKYVQELLLLCEDAGLDPDVIVPEGVALANLFEDFLGPVTFHQETQVGAATAEMIIHIGYSRTLISVLKNKNLITTRAVLLGGRDLAAAVSRVYQLPYSEALKGISEKAFVLTSSEGADKDQVAFSDVVKQSLSPLVTELKRTLADLKSEGNLQFGDAHLMGGMSRLLNLGPYLTQELDLNATPYHHLGQGVRTEIDASESTDKISSVAVGLALEGLRKPRNPAVNFRKNEFSKQNQNFKIFWDKYQDLAKAGALLFVIFFVYTWLRVSFSTDNLDAVEKILKEQTKNPQLNITAAQTKPESLKKFIKGKREEIESKKQVLRMNQMISGLDVVKSISTSLPKRDKVTLDLRRFQLEGEKLILEGLVNGQGEVALLQSGLRQLPQVSDLQIMPSALPAPGGKASFVATMRFTRLPPPERKAPR